MESKKHDSRTGKNVDCNQRSKYHAFWSDFSVKVFRLIVAYARTLTCDPSLAEDLAQATVLRVLYYLPEPDSIQDHLSYLKRMAKNLFLDSRKKPIDTSLDELLEANPDHPALKDPTNVFENLEHKEDLRTIFEPSTPELIITLEMLVDGCTWEEIAAALNEPVWRTKFRWYSAIKRVHDRLRPHRNGI
jgi:RNA polymerase sigma factor (sigma-70 family)